jgi:hypothetical protein
MISGRSMLPSVSYRLLATWAPIEEEFPRIDDLGALRTWSSERKILSEVSSIQGIPCGDPYSQPRRGDSIEPGA